MRAKLRYIWDNFESWPITMLFALLLLVVVTQIVSRVIFNMPFMFTEELARFLYIWIALVGLSRVIQQDRVVRLVLLSEKLKGWKQDVFQLTTDVLSLAVLMYLNYWSLAYIRFMWIDPSPALGISMGLVYLCLPVGWILSMIRVIERGVKNIKSLKQKLVGDSHSENNERPNQG